MGASVFSAVIMLSMAAAIILAQAPTIITPGAGPQASEVIDADGPYEWNSGTSRTVSAPITRARPTTD